jgi:hypothetical protein
LAMVIGAPLPLALRLAAHVLLRVELRGLERLLAVTAAARHNISSEERLAIFRGNQNIETAIECSTASPPVGCRGAANWRRGASLSKFVNGPQLWLPGTRLSRRKWLRFYAPADK